MKSGNWKGADYHTAKGSARITSVFPHAGSENSSIGYYTGMQNKGLFLKY